MTELTSATNISSFGYADGTICPAYDSAHAGKFMMIAQVVNTGPIYRLCDNPWGPFTSFTEIYAQPDNNVNALNSGNGWWYRTSAHPEISASNECIITYAVNLNYGSSFQAKDNSDLYHARFIRLRDIQ